MTGILRDIRYSVRGLLRRPGLALALIFTIALGLGSNVTVRGFIRGLTVRQSPVAAASRVVSIFRRDRYRAAGPVSDADYLALQSHADLLEWIGSAQVSQSAARLAGQPTLLSVAAVTPEVAALLQLPLDGGVAISHRVWQNEFQGKAAVRGETVRIGDADTRVSGIAPDWLEGVYSDRPVDLWRPLRQQALEGGDRTTRSLWVLARLRPAVPIDRLRNALGASEFSVLPYTGMAPEMAEGLARIGTLLQWAAGFVFFIACVNVASFLLGRATLRSHETSIRIAIGASRSRLAQTVATDSLVICAAGGALSLLFAFWTSEVVPALLFERDAGFLVLAPNFFSIAAASAAGLGIILACGLLPLLEIPYDRPAAVLGRESAGPSRAARAVRSGLIIGQMAGCCLLVVCTGFLYGGFRASLETGASHRLGQPILATVQAHPDVAVDVHYFQRAEEAARSLAGVSGMAWTGLLPGGDPAWQSFRIEPRGLPLRDVEMDVVPLTPELIARLSLPPKAGRMFGLADRACPAAIVNEEAAAALFGDETAGRSIYDAADTPIGIIGVVALRRKSATSRARPTIYFNATAEGRRPAGRIAAVRFSAPAASRLERAELNRNVVSPGYFAAMGLSLIAGRLFPESPGDGGCRVAVVNQEAADLYFAGNAVGAALIDDTGRRTGIIGVVHAAPLGIFERRSEPTVYFPMAQDCLPAMTLILGARVADAPMLAEVRQTLESVPGRGPAPPAVKTLQTQLSRTALAPLHIATAIVGACAATALLLGVLGLYGTLNDAARARRRDLAIRIALGARRRHVVGEVLRDGGRLAGAGAVAGLAGSLVLAQLLPHVAAGIGPPKSWVWMAGPIVLAAAVAVAGILPSRRALMADPLRILRRDN